MLAPLGGRLHRNSAGKVWRYYGDETALFLGEIKILASPARADFDAAEKAFADGRVRKVEVRKLAEGVRKK